MERQIMNTQTKTAIQQHFATNLRNLRYAAGITQEELAFHLGINHTIISRYESGQANPTLFRLHELAEILNCAVADIICV